MNVEDALTLHCEDAECRSYEWQLRSMLYQWQHFPVDMVIEPFIRVHKAIKNSGFGIDVHENVAIGDPSNSVVGHAFTNQFTEDSDLAKIKNPVISHDEKETTRRLEIAHELFDGTLDVVAYGYDPYLSVWDPISSWMSVEGALYAIIDRPEFMKEMVRRVVQGYLAMLDQLEEQNLMCHSQSTIHCTGAYSTLR